MYIRLEQSYFQDGSVTSMVDGPWLLSLPSGKWVGNELVLISV